MSTTDHDVVVVGAGPVGLSLALGLARNERSVLVLEKEPGTSEHSRAPIIWPRTQEVLAGLGVLERLEAESIVRTRVPLWDADRERVLLRFPIEELEGETPCPQLLVCPQSQTERVLCEAVQNEPTAEVRFSAEATDLDRGEDGVAVTYERDGTVHTATGAFVAGCDGAHSRVRETVADAFEGMTYDVQAALADVRFKDRQDVRYPRMTRRRGVATAMRIDDHRWRVIMPRPPAAGQPLNRRIEQAVDDLFPADAFEATWKSEFSLHRRLSDPFVDGRVGLAGDAAHLTSPVGGQGMNLGIQDAAALTDALQAALDRDRPDPLARYADERREAVEGGVVWATDTLTKVLLVREGAALVPALRGAGVLLQLRPLRRAVLRRMAMLEDPSRPDGRT